MAEFKLTKRPVGERMLMPDEGRELTAKYAGLLQTCKIIANMHVNEVGGEAVLLQTIRYMQQAAREAVENGS